MPKDTLSLASLYKEVKSLNQRLDFLEDLAEQIIIGQLPKAKLTSSQAKELKKRIAEMKTSRHRVSDLTLFTKIDEQYKGKKRPTEREILDEIQAHRKEKRLTQLLAE